MCLGFRGLMGRLFLSYLDNVIVLLKQLSDNIDHLPAPQKNLFIKSKVKAIKVSFVH